MLRALKGGDDGMRQRATDVLLAAVQHDAQPLRDFFTQDPGRRQYFQLLLKYARARGGQLLCNYCGAAPCANRQSHVWAFLRRVEQLWNVHHETLFTG